MSRFRSSHHCAAHCLRTMINRLAHGLALRTPPSRRSAPPVRCRRKSWCPAAIGTAPGPGRALTMPRWSALAFRILHIISRSRCISISTPDGSGTPRRGHLCNDRRRALDRDHAMGGSDRESSVPRRSRRHHRSDESDGLRRNADLHAAAFRCVAGSDVLGWRPVVGRLHVLDRAAERHRQAADGRSFAASVVRPAATTMARRAPDSFSATANQRQAFGNDGDDQLLFHRQSESTFPAATVMTRSASTGANNYSLRRRRQ